VTNWKVFPSPNWTTQKAAMKAPVIFDGRSLYEPHAMLEANTEYFGIGRNT
jgi:UDPglucose 6-dehydrogenase